MPVDTKKGQSVRINLSEKAVNLLGMKLGGRAMSRRGRVTRHVWLMEVGGVLQHK